MLETSDPITKDYIMSGQGLEATIERVARQVLTTYNEAWSPKRHRRSLPGSPVTQAKRDRSSPHRSSPLTGSPQVLRGRFMSPEASFFYVTDHNGSLGDFDDSDFVLRVVSDEPSSEYLTLSDEDHKPPRLMRKPTPTSRPRSMPQSSLPTGYYREVPLEKPTETLRCREYGNSPEQLGAPVTTTEPPCARSSSCSSPESRHTSYAPPGGKTSNTGLKPWTSQLIENYNPKPVDRPNTFRRT